VGISERLTAYGRGVWREGVRRETYGEKAKRRENDGEKAYGNSVNAG
jgi:hypothetical protein